MGVVDDTPSRLSDPEFERALAALRAADRICVAPHENPDGDAIGSLVAAAAGLRALGKSVRTYLEPGSTIPSELRLLDVTGLERRLDPASLTGWTLLTLDCATLRRLGHGHRSVVGAADALVSIDHHYDNTRFGDVNLVVGDASSTGEVLRDLFTVLGVELTPEIAEALYIALVTDTNRFQYTNTTPRTLRLAAELVEAGADVHRVFQGVYESLEFAKLKLIGRALDRAQVYEGGRLVVSYLLRSDFTELNVAEAFSEGIIDSLRAVDGAEMAATIREPPEPPGADRRVSMRSSRDDLDVSAIARKRGGGVN